MVDVLSSMFEMAKRPRSAERQVHPTGERWTVDDSWKQKVRDELVKREWSQADLAEKIDAVPASITNLLKPGTSQSRLIRRIQKVFGWVDTIAPVSAIERDDALRRLQRRWGSLSDEERQNVAAIVESLAAKR
jgi:hypothetical protein